MTLAVIPARGGSKRIPGKNIREFCGKPIIAYSIDAALNSGVFERVVVSTDDPAIAEVARNAGADVPFMRPAHLSDDHTATVPVIKHAIEALGYDQTNSLVCCIYATAPFIASEDLHRAFKVMSKSNWDYVFPITSFAYPIQRALIKTDSGGIDMMDRDQYSVRSQDLTPAFHDVGQFYFGRADAWLNEKPIFLSNSFGLEIPRFRVQDIDDEDDWVRAELIHKALFQSGYVNSRV